MAGLCFVVAVLDVSGWLAARLSVGNVWLQTFSMGKRPVDMFSADPAAVDKVNGRLRPCMVRIRYPYARGSHHHLWFALWMLSSRPAVGGAHAPLDSYFLTPSRPFSDACSCALSWSFLIEGAPGNSSSVSSRWVAELRYWYLG